MKIVNDLALPSNITYTLLFKDTTSAGKAVANYNVRKEAVITDVIDFYDTNYSKLTAGNVDKSYAVKLTDNAGTVYTENSDFVVEYSKGLVRRTHNSKISTSGKYNFSYKYYPIFESTNFNYEDSNPVVDGIQLKLQGYGSLAFDTVNSKWISGKTNLKFIMQTPSSPLKKVKSSEISVNFPHRY